MLTCFSKSKKTIAVHVLLADEYKQWLKKQSETICQYAKVHVDQQLVCYRNDKGQVLMVTYVVTDKNELWQYAQLASQLPKGHYSLKGLSKAQNEMAALAWGLASYRFDRYKKQVPLAAALSLAKNMDQKLLTDTLESVFMVRDLVNTPANDLMPKDLVKHAKKLATSLKATCRVISGKALLKENFPLVYAVGRTSVHESQLIDMRWGKKSHPGITLVGKGVCYDTGGLSLKPTSGMLNMKKDMGGAAHVLALAQLIVKQKLPVNLRVIVPSVDNAVGGDAFRPGDVLSSRSGKTIEVTNTDAEGRLILADALTLAMEDKPDLLIDFATLTGACRVAVGTEIAGMFVDDDKVAHALEKQSKQQQDPVWRLPLYQPYSDQLASHIADLANSGAGGYGSAISAALFLQQFVGKDVPWVHFDLMAFNPSAKPGRPKGGEAMGLRATFAFIKQWLN